MLMDVSLLQRKISVKKSNIHGYGVFAAENIKAGDIIEECYVLLVTSQLSDLSNYYFQADDDVKSAIPLGFGCIYNHSNEPNAGYKYDSERQLMVFTAKRDIQKGSEIFTSYGQSWFDSRRLPVIPLTLSRAIWRSVFGFPMPSLTFPMRVLITLMSVIGLAYLVNHI
jgi:SET domain-containing protein